MSTSVFLLLCTLLATASALSCSAQWQCASVSEDYNFVECNSGSCSCKTSLGFAGSATVTDKCRCDNGTVAWLGGSPICKHCFAPREIIYQNSIPSCLNGVECEALVSKEERNARRIDVVRAIYEELLGDGPMLIVSGQRDLSHLYASNVHGRVTPVGDFTDFEGVIEYFYGLVAAGGTKVPHVIFPYGFQVEGDRVAVRVDIMLNGTTSPPYNLTETGFFKFNSEDKVESFDLAILRIGTAIDVPAAARPATINRICATLLNTPGRCQPGTYEGSYSDFADCVSFMNSIPFGSWDNAHSNTVSCRFLHSILTVFRPELHCKHSGKTGGGKCVDVTYESWFDVLY